MLNIFNVEAIKKYLLKYTDDSLYKNSYILIINTALASVFGFIFWGIAAKMYSTRDVGLAVTMISLIGLLSVFSNLGFSSSLIRYLSNSDGQTFKKIINTCFTVSGIISVALSVLFLIEIEVLSPALMFIIDNPWFYFAFIVFSVVMSLNTLQVSIFIGKRITKFELIKNLLWNILKIVFLFAFIWLGAVGIFSAFGAALVIAFLFGIIVLIPKIHPDYRFIPNINMKILNDLAHYSAGNYIADFFMTAPTYILPLMVANILNPEGAAYFYIAWMITQLILIIPNSISNSFFAEGSHDERRLYENFKQSLSLSLILVVPAILVILLIGGKALSIFGKEYSENATVVLMFLVLSGIPYTFNRMYVTLEKVKKNITNVIAVNAVVDVIGLGSVYLLIDSMGLLGVGVGWILGQGIVMISVGIVLYKSRKKYPLKV